MKKWFIVILMILASIITIVYGTKTLKIKVLEVLDSSKKVDAEKMYEVIDEIRHDQVLNPVLPNKEE